jgi:tRNA(Ile)-lysidine synthase
MALAFLFKQLQEKNLVPGLDLTAFIVDHAARPDSQTEARKVAKSLEDLGLTFEEYLQEPL